MLKYINGKVYKVLKYLNVRAGLDVLLDPGDDAEHRHGARSATRPRPPPDDNITYSVCVCVRVCIYIYIYIEREREIDSV